MVVKYRNNGRLIAIRVGRFVFHRYGLSCAPKGWKGQGSVELKRLV